jgi:hypothetical protein
MVCREAGETRFALRCNLPQEKLWSVWLVGVSGELWLGCPVFDGREAVLEKRFSHRLTQPLGQLRYAELRSPGIQTEARMPWKPIVEMPPFRTAWIRRQIQPCLGALCCYGREGCVIAVPYLPEKPFPLMPMFCFAHLQTIGGRPYLVLQLDDEEQPMLR